MYCICYKASLDRRVYAAYENTIEIIYSWNCLYLISQS